MEIIYRSDKLRQLCIENNSSRRKYGDVNARRIHQRIAELHAAENLAALYSLPALRCHELKGDRKGQFAVRINGGLRLIFQPGNNPIPYKLDGGILLTRVTIVHILEISSHYKK